MATTDPQTLPDLSIWYLVTNLSAPIQRPGDQQFFPPASREEIIRLYGLRMWVEQSDTHVKHALGWSQYQVRSDQAIRRHWPLVYCAFSFCWSHVGHPSTATTDEQQKPSESEDLPRVPASVARTGKNNQRGKKGAATGILAESIASGTRLVGALEHAAALLERLVATAPTSCSATPASLA